MRLVHCLVKPLVVLQDHEMNLTQQLFILPAHFTLDLARTNTELWFNYDLVIEISVCFSVSISCYP